MFVKQNFKKITSHFLMSSCTPQFMIRCIKSHYHYDVASESVIKSCIKNDNQLVD